MISSCRKSNSIVKHRTIDDENKENKKITSLKDRPEFTTLMKAKVRTPVRDDENAKLVSHSHQRESQKKLMSRSELISSRREFKANNLSYEAILHDQMVAVKALLIRTQAANTAHDPAVIMSFVGQRAEECVKEEVDKIVRELEEIQGPNPTHR